MNEAAYIRDAPAGQADASFAELTARRKGRLRRYLHRHPWLMDALVAGSYSLLVAPTGVDAAASGNWLPAALLLLMAGSMFLRRFYPVGLVAFVAVVEVAVTLLHPWGSNVSAGLVLSLCRGRGAHPPVRAPHNGRSHRPACASLSPGRSGTHGKLLRPRSRSQPGRLPPPDQHCHRRHDRLVQHPGHRIGISVRQRREHEQEVAAWAARTASLASVNERNRIAREMHDVVAHSLTVMISLSDGAAVVVRKSPERAGEVLGELSRTGRTALADMRRVLGVLRDDTGATAARPPLTAGDSLTSLLEGFRTAGLPLHYSHTGPALPDDAAFQLTVYRIVQESLTNVLRYGRALGRVDVTVVRASSTVTIDVVDDGAGATGHAAQDGGTALSGAVGSPGSGQGLAGMAERSRIYSGSVEAGPSGRGWRVHAVLSCPGDDSIDSIRPYELQGKL